MKLSIKKVWLVAMSFICGFVTCALFVAPDSPPIKSPSAFWVQHVSAPLQAPAPPECSFRIELPADIKMRSSSPMGGQHLLPWAEPRPNVDLIDMRPANELNTGK